MRAAHAAAPGWAALGAAGRGRAAAPARRPDRSATSRSSPPSSAPTWRCCSSRCALRVILRAAANFRNYADLAVAYEERDWHSKGTWNRVQRMPAGPAAVITPWNAPFMLSTWKIAPALAAGCPVVLKPAEWSPLSCSLLADLQRRGRLPAGRLQRAAGDRRAGRRGAGRAPAAAPDLVHRLARDRPPDRRGGRQEPRARSPASSAARAR